MTRNHLKEMKKKEKEERRRTKEIDGVILSPVLGPLNAKKMGSLPKFVKEKGEVSDQILECGIGQFNRIITKITMELVEIAKEVLKNLHINHKEVLLDLLYLFLDNVKLSKSHMKNVLLRASSVGRLWMSVTNGDKQSKNLEEYVQKVPNIDAGACAQFVASLRNFSRITVSLRNFLKGSSDQQKNQLETLLKEEPHAFIEKNSSKGGKSDKTPMRNRSSLSLNDELEEEFFTSDNSLRIQGAMIGSARKIFEHAASNNLEGVKSVSRWISIDLVDDNKRNALHHASMYNAVDVIDFLLEKGIPINTKDDEDFTPLELACKYGHEKLALYLRSRGAEFNILSKNIIELMKRNDFTPGFWIMLSKSNAQSRIPNQSASADEVILNNPITNFPNDLTQNSSFLPPSSPLSMRKKEKRLSLRDIPRSISRMTLEQKKKCYPLLAPPFGELLYVSWENLIWSVYEWIGEVLSSSTKEKLLDEDLTTWLKTYLTFLKSFMECFQQIDLPEFVDLRKSLHEVSKTFILQLRELESLPESQNTARILGLIETYFDTLRDRTVKTFLLIPDQETVLGSVQSFLLTSRDLHSEERDYNADLLFWVLELYNIVFRFGNGKPDLMNSIIQYCWDIQEMIDDAENRKKNRDNWLKNLATNIRRLITTIKDPSSNLLQGKISNQQSLERMEKILNEKKVEDFPHGFDNFLALTIFQCELMKGEKNHQEVHDSIKNLINGVRDLLPGVELMKVEADWNDDNICKLFESLENLIKYFLLEGAFTTITQITKSKLAPNPTESISYRNNLSIVSLIFSITNSVLLFSQEKKTSK